MKAWTEDTQPNFRPVRRTKKRKWAPTRDLRSQARSLRRTAEDLINHGHRLRRQADELDRQAARLGKKKRLKKLLREARAK